MYEYSITMERMKIIHALSLGSIAFFVLLFTKKFKILNDSHYAQLMLAAVTITVLYFIPIAYICYQAFLLAGDSYFEDENVDKDWETDLKQWVDWMTMLLRRSDLGSFGLVVSCLTHLQIYFLLFVM